MSLSVSCGPFQPSLEKAFVERIKNLSPSPQHPVCVVLPSQHLSDRLQRLLAQEQGLSLLGCHFHTFYSLALHIWDSQGGGEGRFFKEELFYEKLIDKLLKGSFGNKKRALPKGFASAFRASLTDLVEAGIDPESLQEHFSESLEDVTDRQDTQRLLNILTDYKAHLAKHRILSRSSIVERATALLESQGDGFTDRFREYIYYGFYDLNGLQLDFFMALARRCSCHLYFPYRKGHLAFSFAKRFFDLKLHGGGSKPIHLPSEEEKTALGESLNGLFDSSRPGCPVKNDRLTVVNASGHEGEVWAVAKEILKLHEEKKISFNKIGVVARDLSSYRTSIRNVFEENAIPFYAASAEPLSRYPLATLCLSLLTLKKKDFPVHAVLNIVGAPGFNRARFMKASPSKQEATVWSGLIQRLRLHSGWAHWKGRVVSLMKEGDQNRLTSLFGKNAPLLSSRGDLEDLVSFLDYLHGELSKAEKLKGWDEKIDFSVGFINEVLGANLEEEHGPVWQDIKTLFKNLRGFDHLAVELSWEDYLGTLEEKFSRFLRPRKRPSQGVRVLSAMDARGESFDVLFLIGLKEGLFPRQIQEDPLLRDPMRSFLQQPGGYWIFPKTAGYDEEKLLFYLMVSSAKEKLYCVYPRSNDEGKAEVPSLYLRELLRACGRRFPEGEDLFIPRQPYGRLESLPPAYLSPQEITLLLARHSPPSAPSVLESLSLDGTYWKGAFQRLEKLNSFGALGEMDGMVPVPQEYLKALGKKGISPSALDLLGKCPFQFFAKYILGIEVHEEPLSPDTLAAPLKGKVYHLILERFYRKLLESGFWESPLSPEQVQPRLEKELDRSMAEIGALFDAPLLGIYPLLWKSIQVHMRGHLLRVLRWDLEELQRSGFIPRWFEENFETVCSIDNEDVKFQGRPDRVDVSVRGDSFRVVDYKTRWPSWKKLKSSVLSGGAYQPPVYLEMVSQRFKGASQGMYYYGLENKDEQELADSIQAFSPEVWADSRGAILRNIGILLSFVRKGNFLIVPDETRGAQCDYCPYPTVCRKSHTPSRHRAEQSSQRRLFDQTKISALPRKKTKVKQ